MRLISEDGLTDLPYERVALEIVETKGEGDFDPDYWEIIAYDTSDNSDDVWTMAVYFSLKEARAALLQARFALQRSCFWFEFGALQKEKN